MKVKPSVVALTQTPSQAELVTSAGRRGSANRHSAALPTLLEHEVCSSKTCLPDLSLHQFHFYSGVQCMNVALPA